MRKIDQNDPTVCQVCGQSEENAEKPWRARVAELEAALGILYKDCKYGGFLIWPIVEGQVCAVLASDWSANGQGLERK